MLRPSHTRLPPELARAAQDVARVLRSAGERAWLVGGAVRDLALGREPKDVDVASAARPEALERLFPATYAAGKAFGTIVVHSGEVDVQVTTFRRESGYDDARRPTHVAFGDSLEEDAARRDFTCNALYLDPLTDELVDPTGGLADLEARRLRCVGAPARRFAEDGLRLLRLARLAAHYALEVDADTSAGARAAHEALGGVSPERVFGELERMARGPAPARAVRWLLELGLLERLPGVGEMGAPAERVAALTRLAGGVTSVRFFATLFRPLEQGGAEAALEALGALRPPRLILDGSGRIWRLEPELLACLAALESGAAPRSRLIRLVRAPEFEDALVVWSAWRPDERREARERLAEFVTALAPGELAPAPLVTSEDLARTSIARGPRWKELLLEAERLQLDGELCTRADALAWLAALRSEGTGGAGRS